ncbi:MAG TPA: VOC family protein [Pseudonocardiaceae bacterium]
MTLSIGMVTIDCTDPQALAGFWTAALGTTVAADYGAFVLLAGTPALGLQKVPEVRAGVLADPEGNEFCVGSHHG